MKLMLPIRALLAAACLGLLSPGAFAQTAVKVAGLRTIALLPVQHAARQGYFKREGLDVEIKIR